MDVDVVVVVFLELLVLVDDVLVVFEVADVDVVDGDVVQEHQVIQDVSFVEVICLTESFDVGAIAMEIVISNPRRGTSPGPQAQLEWVPCITPAHPKQLKQAVHSDEMGAVHHARATQAI